MSVVRVTRMTHSNKPLNDRHQVFVTEYLKDLNATAAAERAGYSARTARKIASALLKKSEIAAAIKAEMEKREQRTQVTVDRVVEELAAVAFANIGDAYNDDGQILPIGKMPRSFQSAIEIYQRDDRGTRIKMHDKISALEKLGRHLGMFNDKLQLKGDQENPIAILVQQLQGTTLRVAHDQAKDSCIERKNR